MTRKPDAIKMLRILKENPNQRYDAMTMMREYIDMYDERYDWHEFSSLLDHANRHGLIEDVKPGGFVTYRWWHND